MIVNKACASMEAIHQPPVNLLWCCEGKKSQRTTLFRSQITMFFFVCFHRNLRRNSRQEMKKEMESISVGETQMVQSHCIFCMQIQPRFSVWIFSIELERKANCKIKLEKKLPIAEGGKTIDFDSMKPENVSRCAVNHGAFLRNEPFTSMLCFQWPAFHTMKNYSLQRHTEEVVD